MIGDLTGAPEPVVVKLFSQDPDLLEHVGAAGRRRARRRSRSAARRRSSTSRTASRTRPAVRRCVFTVNPRSRRARRLHAPRNSARSRSRWSTASRRPRRSSSTIVRIPLRVRFPASARASLEAMSNTMLVSSTGATATLGSLTTVDELPGQTEVRRENLQRLVEVTARLEGVDMGTGIAAVQKAVADLKLPPSIRVEYGGTYQEQQKSFRDLDDRARAGGRADFPRAAVRVPLVHARRSPSCRRRFSPRPACSSRC